MKEIQLKMQEQFNRMCLTRKLYRTESTELWKTYLAAFSVEYRNVFRDPNSTEHNCNNCHNFIRRYGNIVAIDESGELMTLFDIAAETQNEEYKASIIALRDTIKASKIKDVFFETFAELNATNYESCKKGQASYKLGIFKNHKQYIQEEADKYGKVNIKDIYTFHHFALTIPGSFVDSTNKSIKAIMAEYKDKKQVFQRGMEEISLDTLQLVKDLIIQGSLLNGDSYLKLLDNIITIKKVYDDCSFTNKDNWFWSVSYSMPEATAKFRNTLLGTLCVELSQGEELNKACLNWNKRADPVNYMKATAPITQKQIKEAQKFVEENGYAESFDRRLATIDDIKASEILHLNSGDGKIKTASIFDNIKATATRHKRAEFDKVEEVAIEKFMKDILPTATGLEVYVENRLQGNFCTLTKSVNDDSKNIFKYPNNYSKTFNGNLAGKSQIKDAVESLGGKTDGVLRFSIMWAEDNGDNSDLDAHCIEPNGDEIKYNYKISRRTGGNLDIDVTQPQFYKENKKDVVENITYPDLSKMEDGIYKFFVHQYAARNSKGFKAEIEFNGELYSYNYKKAVSGNVQVAKVTLKNGEFAIEHKLPLAENLSKDREIWGISTNNFHKVNLVCLSPNYWGDSAVGNKHYMFMLEGCKVDIPVRGFHNEDLNLELLSHRKVMEVLGATTMIEPTDKQLSGLGFNSTVSETIVVKVHGYHKRILKIKI